MSYTTVTLWKWAREDIYRVIYMYIVDTWINVLVFIRCTNFHVMYSFNHITSSDLPYHEEHKLCTPNLQCWGSANFSITSALKPKDYILINLGNSLVLQCCGTKLVWGTLIMFLIMKKPNYVVEQPTSVLQIMIVIIDCKGMVIRFHEEH